MLKSLFGDSKAAKRFSTEGDDDGFAATAIMDTMVPDAAIDARPADPFAQDLVVSSGSPAATLREHFAKAPLNSKTPTRFITLIDPVRVWATLVISTLSEACSQPIERLHLREHHTLRTLATIERTTVVRHSVDQLKVMHADVRAPGRENAEIQVALMERSHLTAIVVGPMQAQALDALLVSLREACALPSWRCPTLLFMLPLNATWIQHKVRAVAWPAALQVLVADEPMTSASAVWNSIVAQWRVAKAQQTSARDMLLARRTDEINSSEPAPLAAGSMPLIPGVAGPARIVVTPELAASVYRPARTALQADQAQVALSKMSSMDGLLACALVNDETSQVLARETRLGEEIDLERTALACAKLMRAHRESASSMGLSTVEEVTSSSSGRQVMLRPASHRPGFFMMALLDKQRTNMTLARLRLMELDKHLT